MSDSPFTRWAAPLGAATDSETRRTLVVSLASWRAANLGDVAGQRDATWTLARLFQAQGLTAKATTFAKELVSLCRDDAPEAERFAADDLLAELTGAPRPARATVEPRPPRNREPRPADPRGPRVEREVDLGLLVDAGRYDEAVKAARSSGPRTPLVLAWIYLHRALDTRDPVESAQKLVALREDLRRQVLRSPPAAPQGGGAPSELEGLLGRPVPARRLAEALETRLAERPDLADALASAAIEHHRATEPDGPGAHLGTTIGAALARSGRRTRRALEEAAGTPLGAVFSERGFHRLVEVLRGLGAVPASGPRRGILRDEPDDARVWTLRLHTQDGRSIGVAAAPIVVPEALAPRLAARLVQLDPTCLLVDADPAFGSAAEAAGVRVVTGDLRAALSEVLGAPAQPRDPSAEPSPRATERPRPFADLIEALRAGASVEEVVAHLEPIKRRFRVFGVLRPVLAELDPAEADARTLTLLAALLRVSPPDARLPEGTTFAVRAAAACPTGRVAAALSGHGSSEDEKIVGARFGGPGLPAVLPVAAQLAAAGCSLGPVHHGVSGRERREHAALAALQADPGGFWRVGCRSASGSGDVWFLGDLTPEGRAAAIQIAALPGRPRVVLAAPGVEIPGLDAIAWDDQGVVNAITLVGAWKGGGASEEEEPS